MIHEEEQNKPIDFSWFSFIGHNKLNYSEKEIFRMTWKRFFKEYEFYKFYHDLEKVTTYEEYEKKQEKDDEWL